MTQGQDGAVERFRPTSGQVVGWIGLVLAAGAVLLGIVSGAPSVAAGALALGVLDWAAMLKPRVLVEGRWLVLRNMFETVRVPLAAIEELAIRQVLAVRAGERRYVSPALGRSFRQVMRSNRQAPEPQPTGASAPSYPDFVEQRLRHLTEEARTLEGVGRYSDEQVALAAEVRREPAWLEIGLFAAAVVAFVVTLVV
ncbi:hypothetical protein [Nocardioides lianchengensis]|uniref:PH domain-containing protein n=1 Tax=Nocardioides lianchengensis TaxID=1045774 RepID=A0A1G6J0H7_9ACTN|nr:hypothetical protein [Nocardioides lianchengensis]NYG12894.1 hypothetical protein [Nocardioides lianchengensis]SDC12191.1 hypothetical protein SAMN05421872_101333 [Nocardioides lianchengensis]